MLYVAKDTRLKSTGVRRDGTDSRRGQRSGGF